MRVRQVVVASVVLVLAVSSAAATRQAGTKAGPATPAPKLALPAAIENAFKAAYPNATIHNVIKAKLKGKDVYEVESVDAGKRRDIIYRPDGVIALLEEEVRAADVPPPVTAAIARSFPKASVTLYEKVIENGVTWYEAHLKGAKVSSVELMPDGTVKK